MEDFEITSVSRLDLESLDVVDADKLSDETMLKVASKMEDLYLNNGFWEDLQLVIDDLKLKQNK